MRFSPCSYWFLALNISSFCQEEAAGDAELCDGGERLRPLGALSLQEDAAAGGICLWRD